METIARFVPEAGEQRESRRGEDENGLYFLETEVEGENGKAEYTYMAKGEHPIGGSASETAIHVTYYDADGIPEGGRSVAKLVDGEWQPTP